jgi:hypothetical protein
MDAVGRQRELTRQLQGVMQERFGTSVPATHPFATLSATVLRQQGWWRNWSVAVKRLMPSSGVWRLCWKAAKVRSSPTPLKAAQVVTESRRLVDSGLARHLDLLDPASPGQATLAQWREAMAQGQQAVTAAQSVTGHWRDKLRADDTETALRLAGQMESSFSRWFKPAWWRRAESSSVATISASTLCTRLCHRPDALEGRARGAVTAGCDGGRGASTLWSQ